MGAKHFGARVTRLEDPALLSGRGRFVDDVKLPGVLHACFVRSPHAHAQLARHRRKAALAMPGVHAVIAADDLPDPMRSEADADAAAQSGDRGAVHPARAGARRSLLCRPAGRGRDRRHALHRRGRRGRGRSSITTCCRRSAIAATRVEDGAPRAHADARLECRCPRSSSPTATSMPPSPTPRMSSRKSSGSIAAAAWRSRRARCSPATIRRPIC